MPESEDVYRQMSKGLNDMHEYIEQAPHRINTLCFVGGVLVILNGALNVLNIFGAFDNLIYYIVHVYEVGFGIVTCVSETHAEFAGGLHNAIEQTQKWMHEWAKGLTMLWGRGLFYIFQGALTLSASSLFSFGFIVGIYMMLMGAMCMSMHFKMQPKENYIMVNP
eukprot:gnl/TRDRNA2_/TRDRNA2_69590_c0_seq1.p1 gnl/TRDRNA2_/TRDRNA2_69590_c0~~gnl/TRDRNA2_/TRDRNA2_69590_c0_seq1.p1  ORF type:complete len:165 (+),score=28.40 gnl/TRDRNA2_/TRDRNA2_69590_c0_seq1:99-593(+)